ncbi:hypothetical protein HED22_09485 [Thalassospira sp. HF15]|uniref:hypothetical protein n=1 Tax=Thalassospira sp. HF15 TaxID=2722755 RepID=UPI0014319327|nr:hypothetical protein [Thalassospira sp. HF15]NIY75875.1 hypothetical protein [Thalassospira sp. HF15]
MVFDVPPTPILGGFPMSDFVPLHREFCRIWQKNLAQGAVFGRLRLMGVRRWQRLCDAF